MKVFGLFVFIFLCFQAYPLESKLNGTIIGELNHRYHHKYIKYIYIYFTEIPQPYKKCNDVSMLFTINFVVQQFFSQIKNIIICANYFLCIYSFFF